MSNRFDVVRIMFLVCIPLAFLTFPGCISPLYLSAIPEVQKSFHSGDAAAPDPTWSRVVTSSEVDIIQYLDDRRLLIGTFRIETTWKTMHSHYFDRLTCIDTKNGDTVWSVSRERFGKEMQALVATAPSIIIIGTNEDERLVSLLNPANGQLLATRPLTGSIATIEHHQSLVLTFNRQDTLFAECLSLSNGRARWGRFFPGMVTATLESGILDMDSVCTLSGQSTVMLRSANGSIVWKSPESLATAKLLATDRYILAGDSVSFNAIRSSDGVKAWQQPAENVQLVASDGVRAYCVVKSKQGTQIRAHDLSTGIVLWNASVPEIHSPIVFDSTSAYFTSHQELIVLRMEDGSRKLNVPIDPRIRPSKTIPDILSIRDSRLYLARETGISAWDISNEKEIYSVPLGGSVVGTLDYQENKLGGFLAALADNPEYHPSISSGFAASQMNGATRWAQSYQQYVKQSVASSVRSGTVSRTSAANRNASAIRSTQSWAAAEANMQYMAAAIQLGFSLGQGIVVLLWQAIGTDWQATHMRMARSVENGYRSIYGQMLGEKYFVRPTFRNGLCLSIVRLEDGRCANIRLFPGVAPFKGPDSWHVPAIGISPDENVIAVRGLIPDTTHYVTYEMVPRVGGGELLVVWKIPYPFIMTLPTNRMRFGIAETPQLATPLQDTSEQALLRAVIRGDKEATEALLKRGVSPNARDEFGHAAYLMATQMFHDDIMDLLIEHGVDVTVTDEEGVDAFQYVNYPPRSPSKASADAITTAAKAYNKWKDAHEK